MKKVFVIGCTAAMIFTACKKDDNKNNSSAVNAQDSLFMKQVSMGNRGEIMAGNVAIQKGDSSAIRDFGQLMVTDHSAAQTNLQQLSGNTGVYVGTTSNTDSVSTQDRALLMRLDSLSGRAFDSVYIHSQVTDHQNTVTLFQNEISGGNNASIKAYANQYLPKIQMHLQKADSLAAKY